MARYRATQPSFVEGVYRDADIRNPAVFTLDKDIEPSRLWEPLDAEAKEAIKKLGVEAKDVKKPPKGAEKAEDFLPPTTANASELHPPQAGDEPSDTKNSGLPEDRGEEHKHLASKPTSGTTQDAKTKRPSDKNPL